MLDMRTDLEGNHQVQRSEVIYNHPQFAGPVLATQYGWAKRGKETTWEPKIHYSRLSLRAIEADHGIKGESMTTQPEALRLADALDAGENFYGESSMWFDRKLSEAAGDAAAELRRLHGLVEHLQLTVFGFETKLATRGYEIQIDDLKGEVRRMHELLTRAENEMRYAGWDKFESDNTARNGVYEQIKEYLK